MSNISVALFIYSLVMAQLWSIVFIIILSVLRRKSQLKAYHSLILLLVLSIICVVRPLIAVELPFTQVVSSIHIYPAVVEFLKYTLIGAFTVFDLLLLIWLVGAIISLVVMFGSRRQYREWMASLTSVRNDRIKQALVVIAGKNADYRLIVSDGIKGPALYGILKPVILIPNIDFSDEELDIVLRHEWSHYIHKDNLVNVIVRLVCAVMWWNPLTHILKHEVRSLLEYICDVRAIRNIGDRERAEYVMRSIEITEKLQASRSGQNEKSPVAVRFENSYTEHIEKLSVIADYKPKTNRTINILLTVAMVVMLLASYLFIVQPHYPTPTQGLVAAVDFQGSYLVPIDDTSFEFFVNGKSEAVVSLDDIAKEPLSLFPIIEIPYE